MAESDQPSGLADDVGRVFPELVVREEDGTTTVYVEGVLMPLIEAVRELDDRLGAIEKRLDARDLET